MKKYKSVLILGITPPPYGGITVYISNLIYNLKKNNVKNTIIEIPNENEKNIFKKTIIYFKYLHKTYFSKEEVVFDFELNNLTFTSKIEPKFLFKLFFKYLIIIFSKKKWVSFHFNGTLPGFVNSRPVLHIFIWLQKMLLYKTMVANNSIREIFLKNSQNNNSVLLINTFLPPINKNNYQIPQKVKDLISSRKPIIISSIFSNESFYNPEILLFIYKKLQLTNPQIGMILLSEDAFIDNTRPRLSKIFENENNIIILSNIDSIYSIFKSCDLFIRTSEVDGDSITIKEALFFNLPVIAADNGNRPKEVLTYSKNSLDHIIETANLIINKKYIFSNNYDKNEPYNNFNEILNLISYET